mmetsp:Transcript_6102/g.14048  ORF Transcript_6102/g.14048 Transcript_6102/m.14048 type:complete len:108 (-) Transcript_6102:302-625(-)
MNASAPQGGADKMNDAQPLTGGVRSVPSGDVLRDQPLSEYDSQVFGRVDHVKSLSLKNRNKITTLAIRKKDVYWVIHRQVGRARRGPPGDADMERFERSSGAAQSAC